MARTYRYGVGRKAINLMMATLLRVGVPAPGRTSYLLTTTGRTSGLERTTPVNLVEMNSERWLVSPYGLVGWVHNLRANAHLRLRRGRHVESLVAHEVDRELAGPVLQQYARQVRVTRPYFDARHRDPVAAFIAEAERHPVFRLVAS
jgi:deazaflavin-dependent oxidoreductase (nitroreductase family)